MIELSEDALICDFAETYQIYDYRSLPLKLAATLSAGLRDNSRIKLLMSDVSVSRETLLLAMIADRIEMFRYSFASKGTEQPVSIAERLLGETKKKKRAIGFKTHEEFDAWLAQFKGE